MEKNFQERRKYKRIRKLFILTYFDERHPEKRFSATQLKNLSCGGLCLITERSFEAGTMLGIEIKSPYFANVTKLKGDVKESRECAKDIIYETRLKFQELSEEEEYILQKIIKFFENKENGYE